MATFGEEHSFSNMGIKQFYRIPVSSGKGYFFINVDRKSVVKIHNRNLIHTWTLTHPHSFTCPVVYSDTEESLYCVMDNNTLISWSIDEDTLKKSVKVKLQESIFAVVSVPKQRPLIIFSSGRFMSTDCHFPSVEPAGFSFIDLNETIIWADATMYESKIKVYCLGFILEEKRYKLHNFTVSKDNRNAKNYSELSLLHENYQLQCWCLNRLNSSFLTVWSDGVILSCTKNETNSVLLSLPDVEAKHKLGIDIIDSSHIAVVKCHPDHKESILEVWDSKFASLKVRKSVKTSSCTPLQVSVINSCLFLQSVEELVVVPVLVEKSTLAAAIGKSTRPSSTTTEFSWDKGKLIQLSSTIENNCSQNMDLIENERHALDNLEAVAQKLMNNKTTYLKYIPESELVKFLLLVVRHKGRNDIFKNNNSSIILSTVFSASFSDLFLVKYLKKLNLEETLITLELLLCFLNNTINISSDLCKRPSDLQVINWACLLIQSHMEALLFSKDKKTAKLWKRLEKCLSDKMEEYEDCQGIRNYFCLLQKKNILPEKHQASKYCIEILDI